MSDCRFGVSPLNYPDPDPDPDPDSRILNLMAKTRILLVFFFPENQVTI